MAAPHDGYGQGYAPADPYAQQSPVQPGFAATSPPPPAGQEHEGGKKKKRGYAAQAYDFGAGANSALGGQPQAGGAFQPPAPAFGGYAAQPEVQPGYGAPQYGGQVGGAQPGSAGSGYPAPAPYGGGVGYQAPDPGYPAPGAPLAGGVGGITQGMGQMNVGGQPPLPGAQPGQPQAGQAAARPAILNQLYPTDLLNQPFNVAELDLPPPPIILPPNVSCKSSRYYSCLLIPAQVKRHTFARCKLPPKIRPFYSQCGSYHTLPPQEIEASICSRHPTIYFSP
jgi:protein transport protein SEC24